MEMVIKKIDTIEELIHSLDYLMENSSEFGDGITFDLKDSYVNSVVDGCKKLLLDGDKNFRPDVAKMIKSKGYNVAEFGTYYINGIERFSDKGFISKRNGLHWDTLLIYLDKKDYEENTSNESQYPKIVDGPSFESFVSTLNELFANSEGLLLDDTDRCGNKIFNDKLDRVSSVTSLCNSFLITSGGGCNWSNISKLKENGFRVYPGESDSFGWLTGCVEKNGTNTVLVYG